MNVVKAVNLPSVVLSCLLHLVSWRIYYMTMNPTLKNNPVVCHQSVVNHCRDILHQIYQVEYRGLQHVVEHRPTLYVMRHASEIDFLVASSIHGKCRYVTKPGLLKIPIIGLMTQSGQHIVVNVQDAASRQKAKDDMRWCLQNGYSLFVLPEGHLSRNRQLKHFHTSSLKMACDLHIPVVTVTLSNAPTNIWQIPRVPLCITFHSPQWYTSVDEATNHIRKVMLEKTQWPTKMDRNHVAFHRVLGLGLLCFAFVMLVLKKLVFSATCLSAAVILLTSQ